MSNASEVFSGFAELLQMLDETPDAAERAAAVALAASATTDLGLAHFIMHRAHLAIRGGARTLLREARAEQGNASARRIADAFVEQYGSLGVRITRLATTRCEPVENGQLFTLETGGNHVGRARFSPDGKRIIALSWGGCAWDEALDSNASIGVWLGQWDAGTGEWIGATAAGQCFEDNGTFDVNPAMDRVAVRFHRYVHVHEIDPAGLVSGAVGRKLTGAEGPNLLTFVDDRRIVSDDGHALMLHDVGSGEQLAYADSVGSWCHVVSRRHERVFVGGSGHLGCAIAAHQLSSLELAGIYQAEGSRASDGERPTVGAIALSPAEHKLATGDWRSTVRVWDVEALTADRGNTREPALVPVRTIGTHDGWVSALRFVDEDRLLSGSWDGAIIEWSLADGSRLERCAHAGYITAIDVSPDRTRALSCASDGNIIVWDLARGVRSRPPFVLPYGSWVPPIVLRVTDEQVAISVGDRQAVFDHAGDLLSIEPCDLPLEAQPHARFVEVTGFGSDEIPVIVEAFEQHDRWSVEAAPCIVVSDKSGVLDTIALDAAALAFAWVDARTLVVLDKAGHVSFWRWS